MSIEPDDIAANLPPQRADEPVSLRQDIIDELADHMQSAARAEQLRSSGTPEEIRAVVLERFGPPGKIAQRLWLDAIRENLTMSQRLMTILVAASTAACLAMALLVWRMQHDFLAAQNTTNQKMIDQLAAMTTRATTAGTNWQPLRVRLVDESGKPVAGTVGFSTKAAGAGGAEAEIFAQSIIADSKGLADFGTVPGGAYWIHATVTVTDHDEEMQFETLIGPGHLDELRIVCPTALPPPRVMKFQIDPPKSLDRKRAYYLVSLGARSRNIAEQIWTVIHADSNNNGTSMNVLVDPDGHVLGEVVTKLEVGSAQDVIPANVALKPIPENLWGYSISGWSVEPYETDLDNPLNGAKTPALVGRITSSSIDVDPQADGSLVFRATFKEMQLPIIKHFPIIQ